MELAAHAAQTSATFSTQQEQHKEQQALAANTRDARTLDRTAFFKDLHKVIEESDVILEVLDSRDPMGCRCLAVEETLKRQYPDKQLVLVLNKIDLVPADAVRGWVQYLNTQHPTVPFKSGLDTNKHDNIRWAPNGQSLGQRKAAFGPDDMMALFARLAGRAGHVKLSMTVGVIGYPNVGKSSVINSMARRLVAPVGAVPGFTRATGTIKMTSAVKIIDCPGVVFSTKDSEVDIILRNCVKIELVKDPVAVAEAILTRCDRHQLLLTLHLGEDLWGQIAAFTGDEAGQVSLFLQTIAHKKGFIKAGGAPNVEAAARAILQEWIAGHIPYYVEPPALPDKVIAAQFRGEGNARVVSELMPELDLDALIGGASGEGFVAYRPGGEAQDTEM